MKGPFMIQQQLQAQKPRHQQARQTQGAHAWLAQQPNSSIGNGTEKSTGTRGGYVVVGNQQSHQNELSSSIDSIERKLAASRMGLNRQGASGSSAAAVTASTAIPGSAFLPQSEGMPVNSTNANNSMRGVSLEQQQQQRLVSGQQSITNHNTVNIIINNNSSGILNSSNPNTTALQASDASKVPSQMRTNSMVAQSQQQQQQVEFAGNKKQSQQQLSAQIQSQQQQQLGMRSESQKGIKQQQQLQQQQQQMTASQTILQQPAFNGVVHKKPFLNGLMMGSFGTVSQPSSTAQQSNNSSSNALKGMMMSTPTAVAKKPSAALLSQMISNQLNQEKAKQQQQQLQQQLSQMKSPTATGGSNSSSNNLNNHHNGHLQMHNFHSSFEGNPSIDMLPMTPQSNTNKMAAKANFFASQNAEGAKNKAGQVRNKSPEVPVQELALPQTDETSRRQNSAPRRTAQQPQQQQQLQVQTQAQQGVNSNVFNHQRTLNIKTDSSPNPLSPEPKKEGNHALNTKVFAQQSGGNLTTPKANPTPPINFPSTTNRQSKQQSMPNGPGWKQSEQNHSAEEKSQDNVVNGSEEEVSASDISLGIYMTQQQTRKRIQIADKALKDGDSDDEEDKIQSEINERFKRKEKQAVDDVRNCQINLTYKGQVLHYEFASKDRTIEWLFAFLLRRIAYLEKNVLNPSQSDEAVRLTLQSIVGFVSSSQNLAVTYIFTQHKRPLSIFNKKCLNISPLLLEETIAEGEYKEVGLEEFHLIRCIGQGGFSRVYLVQKKDSGKMFALKLIDKKFIIDNKKEVIVQNERNIMASIAHPFLLKLQYAFESNSYLGFIMEYCAGGELFYHLRRIKRMTEDMARFYFVEICLGIDYLHKRHIIYRDIKPENILLDIDGHIRIGDFGLSKPDMDINDHAYSFCGSPEYMAPEMLLKVGHTYTVDFYCLGALLYELVTGLPPFYSHDTEEIYSRILYEELEFPDHVDLSSELQHLLHSLLSKDPENRIGAKNGVRDILGHPWFQPIKIGDILDKMIEPPLKPNVLGFNFDEDEFQSGEKEFRKKLINCQIGQYDEELPTIFDSFYFDFTLARLQKQRIQQQQHQNLLQQQQKIHAQQLLLQQQKQQQEQQEQLRIQLEQEELRLHQQQHQQEQLKLQQQQQQQLILQQQLIQQEQKRIAMSKQQQLLASIQQQQQKMLQRVGPHLSPPKSTNSSQQALQRKGSHQVMSSQNNSRMVVQQTYSSQSRTEESISPDGQRGSSGMRIATVSNEGQVVLDSNSKLSMTTMATTTAGSSRGFMNQNSSKPTHIKQSNSLGDKKKQQQQQSSTKTVSGLLVSQTAVAAAASNTTSSSRQHLKANSAAVKIQNNNFMLSNHGSTQLGFSTQQAVQQVLAGAKLNSSSTNLSKRMKTEEEVDDEVYSSSMRVKTDANRQSRGALRKIIAGVSNGVGVGIGTASGGNSYSNSASSSIVHPGLLTKHPSSKGFTSSNNISGIQISSPSANTGTGLIGSNPSQIYAKLQKSTNSSRGGGGLHHLLGTSMNNNINSVATANHLSQSMQGLQNMSLGFNAVTSPSKTNLFIPPGSTKHYNPLDFIFNN